MSIRSASKNLVFLDIMSDGKTIQVLSESKHYVGAVGADDANNQEAIKEEFRNVHESLRRGDIIGLALKFLRRVIMSLPDVFTETDVFLQA